MIDPSVLEKPMKSLLLIMLTFGIVVMIHLIYISLFVYQTLPTIEFTRSDSWFRGYLRCSALCFIYFAGCQFYTYFIWKPDK